MAKWCDLKQQWSFPGSHHAISKLEIRKTEVVSVPTGTGPIYPQGNWSDTLAWGQDPAQKAFQRFSSTFLEISWPFPGIFSRLCRGFLLYLQNTSRLLERFTWTVLGLLQPLCLLLLSLLLSSSLSSFFKVTGWTFPDFSSGTLAIGQGPQSPAPQPSIAWHLGCSQSSILTSLISKLKKHAAGRKKTLHVQNHSLVSTHCFVPQTLKNTPQKDLVLPGVF